MIGAPSEATTRRLETELEKQRRLIGRRITALVAGINDPDDRKGFARLTVGGTRAVSEAQAASADAVGETLVGTLIDNQVPADDVHVPIEAGKLQSGQSVEGFLGRTQGVVQSRMTGGTIGFADAMAASTTALLQVLASEPHRIGRQGLAEFGAADGRFDRWQRIAEPGACSWCRMLATRGAVYHTEGTARVSGHTHCHCSIRELVDPEVIEWSKATGAQRWRAEQAAGTQWQPTERLLRRLDLERQLRVMRRKARKDGSPWLARQIAAVQAELALAA